MISTRATCVMAFALASVLVSREARSQELGYQADAFIPAEKGSRWFMAESIDLRGHGRMALGQILSYTHDTVAVRDANGTPLASVVENQVRLHTGASFIFLDRIRLGFDVPIQLHSDGSPVVSNGFTYLPAQDSASVGDVRMSGDVRLFGRHAEGLTGAIGGQIFVPAGSPRSFTGDGEPHVRGRMMFAYEKGMLALAGSAGVHVRGRDENWASGRIGTEMFVNAAGGILLAQGRILIGPEIQAQTVLSKGFAYESRTTPVEVLLGTRLEVFPRIRIGAGAGGGLTDAYGAPTFRGLLAFEWVPDDPVAPEPEKKADLPDRDGDGVPDADDACGFVPGEKSPFADRNGCPPPPPAEPVEPVEGDAAAPADPNVGPPAPTPAPSPPASEETAR